MTCRQPRGNSVGATSRPWIHPGEDMRQTYPFSDKKSPKERIFYFEHAEWE